MYTAQSRKKVWLLKNGCSITLHQVDSALPIVAMHNFGDRTELSSSQLDELIDVLLETARVRDRWIAQGTEWLS